MIYIKPTWNIIQGNVLDVIDQIEDNSISCIVTSPPYWGLRDYGEDTNTVIWDGIKDCEHEWGDPQPKGGRIKRIQDVDPKQTQLEKNEFTQKFSNFCDKCNAWKGQLGLEPTFNLYIQHLVQIFEALKSKLHKDGSLWVNLGDTYYGNSNNFNNPQSINKKVVGTSKLNNIKAKSLVGIPDRFKIAMIDKGWICRNEIIWHKPSTMPSSAKDRFTVDFEKFFFFTKNKKYYFKQQFEKSVSDIWSIKSESKKKGVYEKNNPKKNWVKNKKHTKGQYNDDHSGYHNKDGSLRIGSQGRNIRTTWKIYDNIEIFKSFLKNRELETSFKDWMKDNQYNTDVWSINPKGFKEAHFAVYPEELIEIPIKACCPEKICIECDKPQEITSCGCNAPYRRGIVFDPFTGSGTTALVALKQNKSFIGTEINIEYIKIANKRIKLNYKLPFEVFF